MRRAVITSDMRLVGVVLLLMAISLITSCKKSEADSHKIIVDGNETVLEIRNTSPDKTALAVTAIQKLLQRQREQSHAWKDSELSKINSAFAAGKSASISESNLYLFNTSKTLYDSSDAYYDPSIGSLVRMWGFYTDEFPINKAVPSDDQIYEWLAHKPAFLEIDIGKNIISTHNTNTQLDFATILEGVSAREIRRIFSEQQIQDALVTMGSDQFSVGNQDSKPWTIKLKDPFGGDLGQIDLQGNEALFSSGNFNKFRVAPTGSRWGHVLNPRTGKPAQGSAAVVVLNNDPILADAASTALMAAGPGNFGKLVIRMKLACAMMVTEENELLITTQMKKRITFFRDPVPLGQPIANGENCTL